MTSNLTSSAIWSERLKTSFDLNSVHQFLEGGEHEALETLRLMQQIERDPVLAVDPRYYELSRDEHRAKTAAKIGRLAQYIEKDAPDFDTFQNRLNLIAIVDPQLGTRIGVHLGLFLSAVRGNGTQAQFDYWAKERGALYVKDVYGCFAMTELAHGSNVAALQTTATYNPDRKTFTINTPSLGATKWWIGGAAHSANHTVCYARLVVNGEDHGVKTFIVPLRDNNHDIFPGIAIGDIGEKMGRDGIDNGWIQFSGVEIPREYMLSRFTTIEDDGTVNEPPLEQLAYGALLGGRVTMVTDSFRTAERFITIAIRYGVARRQFKTRDGGDLENQLLNYPLHQRRLIPLLAWTYAMSVASRNIQRDYKSTIQKLDRLDDIGDTIASLKGIFADSASLKSTCTWKTMELIEECRQSCGGHGYSAYSGFGKGYVDHVVQCTWEGDNNILAQNAGRIVIQRVKKGSFKGEGPFGDLIVRMASSLDTSDWDAIAADKLILSKLYAVHYMLSRWKEDECPEPLRDLRRLFALTNIETYGSKFLQYGVFSSEEFSDISKEVDQLLKRIREHCIGLTDAFKLSDYFINSVLGRYNGDIYNDYMGVVKSLNPDSKVNLGWLKRGTIEERESYERSPETLKRLMS